MNTAELSEKLLQCSICKKLKTAENFYPSKNNASNGHLDPRCKMCQSYTRHEKYLVAKKTPKHRVTRKRCICCNIVLGISKFPIHRNSIDGHANTCWKCKNKLFMDLKNPDKFWWRKATIQNTYKLGRVTGDQLKKLFETQNHKCYYCYCDLVDGKQIHIDHATPRSKKGTGLIENLRISCPDCNRLKYEKNEQDFKQFLLEYARRVIATRTEDSK
jgi:hypothetical protein